MGCIYQQTEIMACYIGRRLRAKRRFKIVPGVFPSSNHPDEYILSVTQPVALCALALRQTCGENDFGDVSASVYGALGS